MRARPPVCQECLRLPRCVSTGPVVVRLAGMANERERERFARNDTLKTRARFGALMLRFDNDFMK